MRLGSAEKEGGKRGKMIHAHVYATFQWALYYAWGFIRLNEKSITKAQKKPGTSPILVELGSKEQHYFMNAHTYKRWCMGREYVLDGSLYRSGLKLRSMEDEDV